MTAAEITNTPWVAPSARRTSPALERRRTWERGYRLRLVIVDTLVVAASTLGAAVVQLMTTAPETLLAEPGVLGRIPAVTAVSWLVMLALFQTRSSRVTGSGSGEFRRVAHATGLAFGIIAIAFVIFGWPGLRGQLLYALPVGLAGLLMGRWWSRTWLVARRRAGEFLSRTIVVGDPADVAHVVATLRRNDRLGFDVVGISIDGPLDPHLFAPGQPRPPVVSTPATVADVARAIGADTIVVASRMADADYPRRLSWQLEGTAAELVLASRLTDVAGPRISLRPVDGLPLMHVSVPSFEGSRHAFKRALDVVVAACALVPVAVATPLIALAIAIDSPGGVFFRQRRVGLNGREFDMLKFRTMRATAEQELASLLASSDGGGPLFKMRRDPRVTRIGTILRRYSLDELPQFWNVLRGDMSVVGPRPPLPSEVDRYDGPVVRRLFIKPGITGLWQVSGRSDLSWDESVRLDLHYVENWSTMTDLSIMMRTVQTMIRPRGAY